MSNRTYNQFCALATALDVVGERWTLLIVRELLPGPRRFSDLLDGLPGVSTNLLTERLRQLEQHGLVVRRSLPSPYRSTVYELTSVGQALEPAVMTLGLWGARFLPDSLDGVEMPSVGTLSLAIKAFFRPDAARGLHSAFEFRFGRDSLTVQVDDGAITVRHGQSPAADAVIQTDVRTFVGVFSGRLPVPAALDAGLIRIDGDPEALNRFLAIASVPQTA